MKDLTLADIKVRWWEYIWILGRHPIWAYRTLKECWKKAKMGSIEDE